MASAFESLQGQLKKLPGVGFRSAERIALHLLVEKPEQLLALVEALRTAATAVRRCTRCGQLAEADLCPICADERRDQGLVCVVEHVPDLVALERSGAHRGAYHVLHGKLSPISGVGPEQLNLGSLLERVRRGEVREIILALSNDVEGEATTNYIVGILAPLGIPVTRVARGLPAGGGLEHADQLTLQRALGGRHPA
jgi:recombination protein RecR